MTTEQQRKMLEAVAKACGLTYLVTGDVCDPEHGNYYWNPLTNSADCAEMCAELEIDTVWFNGFHVTCGDDHTGRHSAQTQDHDNSRLKAWMAAATMVAAKIGGFEDEF